MRATSIVVSLIDVRAVRRCQIRRQLAHAPDVAVPRSRRNCWRSTLPARPDEADDAAYFTESGRASAEFTSRHLRLTGLDFPVDELQ